MLGLALLVLALAACSENLFGSPGSGGGKSNCEDKDVNCWVIEAEERFRGGNFEGSYKAYEHIIVNIDSSLSVGYYGMAKAGLWWWGFTTFNLVDTFKDTDLDSDDAQGLLTFFQEEIGKDALNNYLQATKRSVKALEELNRRDTLTVKDYDFVAGKCKEGRQCLSDMKYRIDDFNPALVLSKLIRKILGNIPFDTYKNGCIFGDPKELEGYPDIEKLSAKYGCDCYDDINGCPKGELRGPDYDIGHILSFDEEGMPKINLDSLFKSDGTLDEKDINDLNESLEYLSEDLSDLIDFLGEMGAGDDEYREDLQANINEFKDYSSFYKLQDYKDNDGDGCIDEEIMFNGRTFDADRDGIVGEDSRFVPSDCWRLESDNNISCNNYNGQLPYKCIYDPDDCKTRFIIHPYKKREGRSDDYFIMTVDLNEVGIKDTLDVVYKPALEPSFWSASYLAILDKKAKSDLKIENQNAGMDINNIGGCWNW
jgi:hypothetical protein